MLIIEPKVFGDARGFFMETWNARTFAQHGLDFNFVQDNHSKSGQGTLRGLHYQWKHPQGKLVRVISGEVFDVAVDLRKSSPTFGNWVGITLSAENKRMLWIPEGLAHGFYVTSPYAEFVYKCSEFYDPKDERSILWNDAVLAINWPISSGQVPILSEKDSKAGGFSLADYFD